MVKFLPFILVPILLIGALGFWRYSATKKALTTPALSSQEAVEPIEVPKALPGATTEDKVKNMEDTLTKLVNQVNNLKSSSQTGGSADYASVQAAIAELKTRVSALEQANPVSATTNKAPLYIPLGATSGPWVNADWSTINDYVASINPDNYPDYTGMNLEVVFRITDPSGTVSVRLYNYTDNSAISSQLDTNLTSFNLQSTPLFKLTSGTKTYKLQIKSPQGKELYIQSARIKVNF